MCGILMLLYSSENQKCFEKFDYSNLHHRGPDSHGSVIFRVSKGLSIYLRAHVLNIRGPPTSQPYQDSHGNILLWNGEVFGGITVGSGNDTVALADNLKSCDDDSSVLGVLQKIQGPYAFIYWQNKNSTLWFGRDAFGRRSLLWHAPSSPADSFILSSVKIMNQDFTEVPCYGVFKIKFDQEMRTSFLPQIELFRWTHIPETGIQENLKILYIILNISLSSNKAVKSCISSLNWDIPENEDDFINQSLNLKSCQEILCYILENNKKLVKIAEDFIEKLQFAVDTRVHCISHESVSKTNECLFDIQQSFHVKNNLNSFLVNDPTCPVYPNNKSSEFARLTSNNVFHNMSGEISSDQLYNEASSLQSLPLHNYENNVLKLNSSQTNKSSIKCLYSSARIAILFSGGLDSAVIASLAHRSLPNEEPIELYNIAFERISDNLSSGSDDKFMAPDRISAMSCLKDLPAERRWIFIKIDVTLEELKLYREDRVRDLIYPQNTVLDDSIGCALWFVSRGKGTVLDSSGRQCNYNSNAKILLVGMGADEQLAGYSRHRTVFRLQSWIGLLREIDMEIRRISSRNMGRDDRIISDHGREAHFPFLDEEVVSFLNSLPINFKCNLSLPRGVGEKLLLRLVALKLGLYSSAVLPKRAIQFGSRIAKLESQKERASDICERLLTDR